MKEQKVRKLTDIMKERDSDKRVREERKTFKKLGVEMPIAHWLSTDMFNYFMELKKKRHKPILEMKDQRSQLAAMGAIKRSRMNGIQWVEFCTWLDQENKLGMLWHAIKNIPEFKKKRKELFNEEE